MLLSGFTLSACPELPTTGHPAGDHSRALSNVRQRCNSAAAGTATPCPPSMPATETKGTTSYLPSAHPCSAQDILPTHALPLSIDQSPMLSGEPRYLWRGTHCYSMRPGQRNGQPLQLPAQQPTEMIQGNLPLPLQAKHATLSACSNSRSSRALRGASVSRCTAGAAGSSRLLKISGVRAFPLSKPARLQQRCPPLSARVNR